MSNVALSLAAAVQYLRPLLTWQVPGLAGFHRVLEALVKHLISMSTQQLLHSECGLQSQISAVDFV